MPFPRKTARPARYPRVRLEILLTHLLPEKPLCGCPQPCQPDAPVVRNLPPTLRQSARPGMYNSDVTSFYQRPADQWSKGNVRRKATSRGAIWPGVAGDGSEQIR